MKEKDIQDDALYRIYKTQVQDQLSLSDVFGIGVKEGYCKCPLHDDDEPSFSVNVNASGGFMWHCFKECGTGNELDFISRRDGISKEDAIRKLGEIKSVDVDAMKYSFDENGREKSLTEIIKEVTEEINTTHAALWVGDQFRCLSEIYRPGENQMDIRISEPKDLKGSMANDVVFVRNKKGDLEPVSKFNLWWSSKARREYEGLTFIPGCKENPGNYYNMWQGWAYEPSESGSCDLYLEHLYENISNKDPKVYDYILDWMAYGVQHPAKKIETAIAFRGKQGTGKNVAVDVYGNLFGNRHFFTASSPDEFLGNFNGHLATVMFLHAEEAFWSGDRKKLGAFKSMITSDKTRINMKHKDTFEVKNHLRLMITSNEDWVVPADLDDRRFLVVDVSDKHKEDRPYFRAIFDELKDGGYENLLQTLMKRDLSEFDFGRIPMTKAKLDVIERSMSTVQRYWYKRLDENNEEGWKREVECDRLYDSYCDYVNKAGHQRPVSDVAFGRELSKLLPYSETSFKTRKRMRNGDRRNVYQFPPLRDCRGNFSKIVKQDVPWTQDDESDSGTWSRKLA